MNTATTPLRNSTSSESFVTLPIAFGAQTMDASAIPGGAVFSVDVEGRVIRGRAVPYGVVGVKMGKRFQFSQGTVHPREGMKVKLWALHDQAHASGVVTEWNDTPEGLDVAFSVEESPEGDRALTKAQSGTWDGLSIGPSEGAKYVLRDGVYHSVDIPIHEISLTPAPVFGGARVTSVAFDTITEEHHMLTEEQKARLKELAQNTSRSTEEEAELTALLDLLTGGDPAVTEALSAAMTGATTFSIDQVTTMFAGLMGGERAVVSAGRPLATEIVEELPYRFDGVPGKHSLVDDMAAARQGDGEAKQRFETFVDETFAVATGNVGSLNPTKNRADLYVPNLTYSTPLWDAVTTQSIEDRTPFTIPKFSSASGLVAAHTEGVEPSTGAFAATVQTVTPTALSGKVEINREVLDQGGSPQVDVIVWGEMLNAWFEAREARVAATLAAVPTAELNLASAVDAALVKALTGYFAGLQFVRGGNRFTRFVADGVLFPALVGASDDAGRPLLPVVGPANAQGTTDQGFDAVQLGNQRIAAAWALGATVASKSYSFVPSSVFAWASAPKRFQFEYQVKSVDLAIWGYAAGAVLRDSDVKPIDYTTADA